MAINYAAMAAMAVRLIAANGQPVTFNRIGRTPGNVSQPWRAPSTDPASANPPETISGIMAAVVPDEEDDDAEGMKRGKATAYVAASTLGEGSPFVQMAMVGFDTMVDFYGTTWRVCKVDRVAPGTTQVCYIIYLEH